MEHLVEALMSSLLGNVGSRLGGMPISTVPAQLGPADIWTGIGCLRLGLGRHITSMSVS